jgi:hypothetical protein
VDVSQDHAEFDLGGVPGDTLSCERLTGTSTAIGRKLAEAWGKCAAKEVDANLILFGRFCIHK